MSDTKKINWQPIQELGSDTIFPPRPFLRPALEAAQAEIKKTINKTIEDHLEGVAAANYIIPKNCNLISAALYRLAQNLAVPKLERIMEAKITSRDRS